MNPTQHPSRREWLARALGLLSVAAAPTLAFAQNAAHIVIVGGGVGGATAAKYLKLFNPALQVTVIEKNPVYIRPTVDIVPMSSGFRLGCRVFVTQQSTAFGETVRQPLAAGRAGYQRMLNDIRKRAEATSV